ncbi:MAG: Ribonuclease R [Parcubacteria group bacterium GW2011_GWF2_38_76]|nr:MAG: Ribonuclease R [Parcubacteria group bacterium GW2011_GWF2_38_76]HBM45656.1 ribonuclease R [Patescibacteria group bacterium]
MNKKRSNNKKRGKERKVKSGNELRPTNGEFLCTISLTKKGEGFGMAEGLKKDIFIASDKLGGAFHGDTAWVKIENEKYFEGRVTRIETRAKEQFVGTIHEEKNSLWITPKDLKAPTAGIMIVGENTFRAKEDDVVLVKITNWSNGKEETKGEIIRVIGKVGENDTEMEAISEEHGFRTSHENVVTTEAKNLNETGIRESDISGRRDFRDITTFTIDPEDAKDFDDAISIRPVGDKFEIGIHIADVSHYLKPGSALDKEARKRATSVYLVDRVIPMLPEILSNNLCSLLPNQDRLTFSAVFTIDNNGHVTDEWFGKTVIHSDKRFTYEDVQKVIEGEGNKYEKEIHTLDKIAKKMRATRFAKGSIYLDSAEIKFKLDEKGKPISIYKKEQKDANKLVEEYMLLANKKVAEKIFKRGEDGGKIFIYRNHELPNSDKISDLKEVLVNFGYKPRGAGTGLTGQEINAVIDAFEGKSERSLIMWIILRSMAKAVYSTDNIGHFGLAYDSYTHFTSPIRRYPDVMVHRLLESHLSGKMVIEDKKEYEKLCNHCSDMERRAMNAERESIKFKQVEYVMDKIGQIFTGIITSVTDWGMYVEAEEILCEGMVALRDIKEDYFAPDSKGMKLVGQKTKKEYRIGDRIKIELISANLRRRSIDFRLVPNTIPN